MVYKNSLASIADIFKYPNKNISFIIIAGYCAIKEWTINRELNGREYVLRIGAIQPI